MFLVSATFAKAIQTLSLENFEILKPMNFKNISNNACYIC